MKLRLSKQAAVDLEEVWLYGAIHWSEKRADMFVDQLRGKFSLLIRYPDVGRPRRELSEGLRSLSLFPFVVFYRVAGEVLEIVRVVHGARDLEGLFTEDF